MRLKGKKELVIVIPGPNFMNRFFKPFQGAIMGFYAKNNLLYRPIHNDYGKSYAKILDRRDREAVWLHWGRGITSSSKKSAVKRLDNIVREYRKKHIIKVVGISLGGEIALESLKNWDKGEVNRLILVCPVIEDMKISFKKIKVYNLFSNHDSFAKLAVRALSPFNGGIKGKNIKNIEIPGFGHDNFCNDDKIKKGDYAGERVSGIIDKLLRI